MDPLERLWGRLDAYLRAEGVDLDDVEVLGRGRGTVVRVTVDVEGGIGVDRIAELSHDLGRLLDEEGPVAGPYTLEVSSPGLERRLRRPEHYRKAVGRQVKVKTTSPVGGATAHRGILGAVDDDGFVVTADGSSLRIPFGAVESARTVFTWERGAKPGKRR